MKNIYCIAASLMMLGCAAPKTTTTDTQVDYTSGLEEVQSRMDSLLLNARLMHKETSERLSNLKIENTTTYLSMPDSTGKQYPTIISNTTTSKEEKENKSIDTKVEASVQRLLSEVSELRQQLETVIAEKTKVKQVSWWQLHKVDVYATLFAMVIVGWLMYKRVKR